MSLAPFQLIFGLFNLAWSVALQYRWVSRDWHVDAPVFGFIVVSFLLWISASLECFGDVRFASALSGYVICLLLWICNLVGTWANWERLELRRVTDHLATQHKLDARQLRRLCRAYRVCYVGLEQLATKCQVKEGAFVELVELWQRRDAEFSGSREQSATARQACEALVRQPLAALGKVDRSVSEVKKEMDIQG